ncbi:MAG: putative cysteine desulfurase 2 [Methanoregulaceae archaeon PtaB.Bin152]|nr:MAG: putative cysteine desulfurase 2 [Methanoregulaceae archaeon PtaB.Bin152]
MIDAVAKSLELPYFEAARSTIRGLHDYPELARSTLARAFNIEDQDHIVFTQNATDSLNILIHGFTAEHRSHFHVITSDLEHNSVLRPLATLEREGRITLSIARSEDSVLSPDAVMSEIRDDTHLAVLCHGSNVLGSLQDISSLCHALQGADVFTIVDGAQTAGLVPLDLGKGMPDAFVFTGHKYLFGLPGIGGFFLRDPSRIAATRQGGTGVDSGNLFQPEEMPLRFETGTHNYPGIVSLCAGVRFVQRTGISDIWKRTDKMTRGILERLSGDPRIILGNSSPDLPVISFNVKGLDCDDVGMILLKKYRIIVRTGLACAPLIHERLNGGSGSVRISLSYMNTPEECEQVADAIQEVARSAGCEDH